MALYYSKKTGGFYHSEIHAEGAIPEDAVEITQETHTSLLKAQADGKKIQADEKGSPVAVDRAAYAPSAKDQIARLEAAITPRRLREAVLGTDNGWLKKQDAQIAEVRAKV